jgi:outer membrane protein TolC
MGGAFGGRLSFSKRFALGPSISFSPYFSRDVTKTHNGVDVALFLPIFRGFGEYYTLAPIFAAQYSKRSSYRSAYQAGLEAILRIITGLYEVARYEKLKELEEQAFQRMKHFCEVIAAKEKIALAESLDVYRAEVELANTQDSLNGITDRLQESRDSLKDLLGIPLNRSIVIDIPLEYEPVDLPYNQAVDIALENRMDVEQARDQLKESIRLSRLAKNHMLPQADFVIDFCNSGHDEILTKEFNYKRDNRWGLGFKTSTDWNPSAQQVAYTNSLMQVSSNERALEQVKSNVAVDVKRQLRAVKRSEERIHTQKEQIQRSQGSLKVARLKFDRGWANNFDVIQAEKNLRIAETALLSALIEYRVSLYRVYMALGLLTDKPEFLK